MNPDPPRRGRPLLATSCPTSAASARRLLIFLGAVALVVAFQARANAATPERGRIIVPLPIHGCSGPGATLPTPPPTPLPVAGGPVGVTYQACPQITGKVPAQVIQYALSNPHAIGGYGLLRNPNVRQSPWNGYRTWLAIRDPGKPWTECNSVVWKAGCP